VSEALAPFSEGETARLALFFDTVIPIDVDAGGWAGGGERLLREHGGDFLDWTVPVIRAAFAAIDADLGPGRFETASAIDREALLERLRAAESGVAPSRERAPVTALIELVHQAFYGGTSRPTGWDVVGYSPLPPGVVPIEPTPTPSIRPDQLRDAYDVVIVGAGAGGGMAAAELAGRGKSVLLIERARPFRNAELRDNHLQSKRPQLYDVTAGPGAGSPRVVENADGSTELIRGDGSGNDYGLVAMALGGGTRVWQAMSWRFVEEDFRMASIYGVPEHSTLVDWPFGYDELAPYYERAEWLLGVAGDSASSAATRAPRTRDLPMPALRDNGMRPHFAAAAAELGWETAPIPFGINSVPRAGRAACVGCAQCTGHTCPVDAKNGAHNTVIPQAVATGNCDLLESAQVLEIVHDGRGRARGVRAVVDGATPVELTVTATEYVIVSAGAIETPRLLLASGLGNDWVGRNHHSHGFAAAWGIDIAAQKTSPGPVHTISTLDFVHRGDAPWGGGVIFDYPAELPIQKSEIGQAAFGPIGRVHKNWMRDGRWPVGAMSMVQEVPHELARISIDPRVTDRFGMPVARLRGEDHPASVAAARFMRDRCVDWVRALGGTEAGSRAAAGNPRGAEHSAGTVRMGTDPAVAATDERGLLFGTANVYVADASLHPTNGGFNPGLTAMASALRVATLLG
jgi:choline dehydrogenase-like flavoprotein